MLDLDDYYELPMTSRVRQKPVKWLQFTSEYLLSSPLDGTISVWNAATLEYLREIVISPEDTSPSNNPLQQAGQPAVREKFSVHEHFLVVVRGASFSLWDIRNGERVHSFPGDERHYVISDVALNKHFAVSTGGGLVNIWDHGTGRFIGAIVTSAVDPFGVGILRGYSDSNKVYLDDITCVVAATKRREERLLVSGK